MRYVWWNGEWVGVSRETSRPVFPSIISDTQAPLVHPATGQVFDSKSAFRAATKAAGCIELGNDAPMTTTLPNIDRKELRDDIARAYSELEQGRPAPKPVSEGGLTRRYDV